MAITVWRVLRALAGVESGVSCRSCAETVAGNDPFGLSEHVCRPCRAAA